MFLLATLFHLALLTSDKYPEASKPDDTLLKEALRECNIEVSSVDWRSPHTDWSNFDAALVYSTWDYYEEPSKFLSFLEEIEVRGVKVYNHPSIIRWNSCKKYLKDLGNLGLKTIDTVYISSSELNNLQVILMENGWDECVIKPQISTSGHNTYRFNLSSIEYIQDILKEYDEEWMIQPFAEEILSEGEWSFVFFDNAYMHCLLKKPLEGNFRVQRGKYTPVDPPEWMLREVQRIIDTLQTRIDVIRRGDEIRIMEIEMIEPSLYLRYFPGSEKKLAEKLANRLGD